MRDIPYISQKSADVPKKWHTEICALACVKMIVDVFEPERSPSLQALIDDGVAMGGYDKKVGWNHEALVHMLRNHGVAAYRQEFRSIDEKAQKDLREAGIAKIAQMVSVGLPVIVSVKKDNGSYHMSLVVGADEKRIVVHDPELKPSMPIPLKTFMKKWRGLAIFIEH